MANKKLTVNEILLGGEVGELMDGLTQGFTPDVVVLVGAGRCGSVKVVSNSSSVPEIIGILNLALSQFDYIKGDF